MTDQLPQFVADLIVACAVTFLIGWVIGFVSRRGR